jgi:hypothetical protein
MATEGPEQRRFEGHSLALGGLIGWAKREPPPTTPKRTSKYIEGSGEVFKSFLGTIINHRQVLGVLVQQRDSGASAARAFLVDRRSWPVSPPAIGSYRGKPRATRQAPPNPRRAGLARHRGPDAWWGSPRAGVAQRCWRSRRASGRAPRGTTL